jgi:hypothetical protein
MNADDLLRTHALNDLRRLIPTAHYWMREHAPEADRELTEPLLREPVRFELTPREHAAAHALAALATYRVRSRIIWSKAYPARDADSAEEPPGMTADEEREVTARLEMFRRAAVVYARMLNDAQLVESFQGPTPRVAAETRQAWTPERLAELRDYREQHGTTKAGKHFGISPARVRALLPRDNPPPKGYSAFNLRPK